jgi:hypothetical protein
MSFAKTPAQLELQEAARDVVKRVVVPVATSVPAGQKLTADHLRTIYRALQPLGYLGTLGSPPRFACRRQVSASVNTAEITTGQSSAIRTYGSLDPFRTSLRRPRA